MEEEQKAVNKCIENFVDELLETYPDEKNYSKRELKDLLLLVTSMKMENIAAEMVNAVVHIKVQKFKTGKTCERCKGRGTIEVYDFTNGMEIKPCPTCRGLGKV